MKYKNNQLGANAEAKISFKKLGPQLTKDRKKAEAQTEANNHLSFQSSRDVLDKEN